MISAFLIIVKTMLFNRLTFVPHFHVDHSCLQSIISERLKQLCDTLADIDILDTAFRTASSRLSSLRHSKVSQLSLLLVK